jgi:hypothetical protein
MTQVLTNETINTTIATMTILLIEENALGTELIASNTTAVIKDRAIEPIKDINLGFPEVIRQR